MKAYCQDVRARGLPAVDQGMPGSELVRVVGVSLATIGRSLKQRRAPRPVRPSVSAGRPSKKITPWQAARARQREVLPDATRAQQCQYGEQTHGRQVSRGRRSRAIQRLNWTRKQRRSGRRNGMKEHGPPIESRSSSCQDLAQKGPCLTLVQDDREVTVGEQWAKAAAHVLSPGMCASQADALYSLVG